MKPVDCDQVLAGHQTDRLCESSYWVSANYLKDAEPDPATVTEAATPLEECTDCQKPDRPLIEIPAELLAQAAKDQAEKTLYPNGATELMKEYLRVHAAFMKTAPKRNLSTRQWARKNKSLFISYLINHMGAKKASQVVMALTAYGEARGIRESNKWKNMAEMAAVITVIQNRAKSGYRSTSSWANLQSEDAVDMRAALYNRQFSCWNLNDPNLGAMMLAKNQTGLARAFQTVDLMDQNQIRPLGDLAKPRTRHYAANNPSWFALGRKLVSPQVQTPGGVVTLSSIHKIHYGVP